MAKRIKSAALNIYVTPELKAAAEKTAADDQRSVTSLVEKLLTDAAKAAGHWPPPAPPTASKTAPKKRAKA